MTARILMLAALLALAACGSGNEKGAQKAKAPDNPLTLSAEEMAREGIEVRQVEPRTIAETIRLTGTIVPDQTKIAQVAPRVAGRVSEAKVVQGEQVMKGQTLAMLESIELGEARAAYRQAKSEYGLAMSTLERAEKLSAEQLVAKKDYLQAKADAERARAALAAAADKLRLLGVSPEVETQNAASYPLTAPFAGTVIERKAVQGELAQADRALFTVADLSTIWVEADVYESSLAKVRPGMAARVSVAAYPRRTFPGTLTYLSSTMNTATRTVKARITVPNPERNLRPGMFANVALESSAKREALVLPEGAVTLIQGQPSVFVAGAKAFAVRAVETADAGDGTLRITAGLSAGERVAVSGVYALKSRLLKSQLGETD